jgi:threonine dehydrogenase-like Zn-dependent dehydrogenase
MPDQVMAMVLEEFGQPLQPREFPLPEPEPGAIVLRLRAAGLCGSDLGITAGEDPRVPLPLIPGHEGIGEIISIGGSKRDAFGEELAPGDLIAFNRGRTCGRCVYCAIKHEPALCLYRQTYGISLSCAEAPHLSGCYAEALYLRPESEIIKLAPDAEPVSLVAATCSGATAAHAIELCDISPAAVVVIFGPGPLGLFAAAFAFERGARQVVMIGTSQDLNRLQLAESFGCLPVSLQDTSTEDRRELVLGLTHRLGAEVVLDCAGHPDIIAEALGLVAPGGVVALPGVATPLDSVPLDPYVVSRKQVRLQGVWVSDAKHLYQALMLAHSARYPLDALVTHVLPLAQANEGLDLLRKREAIKVALVSEKAHG